MEIGAQPYKTSGTVAIATTTNTPIEAIACNADYGHLKIHNAGTNPGFFAIDDPERVDNAIQWNRLPASQVETDDFNQSKGRSLLIRRPLQLEQELRFDGAGEIMTITPPANGDLTFASADSFSIEFQMNVAVASSDETILLCGAAGAGVSLETVAGDMKFTASNGASVSITSGTAANDAADHHWVFVRDGANALIYIYLDGASDAVAVASATFSNAAVNWILGAAANIVDVAMMRIYKVALTATQVAALAASTPEVSNDIKGNIVGEWMMEEGTGTVSTADTADNGGNGIAGNGNNGVFTGPPTWQTGPGTPADLSGIHAKVW